MNKTNYNYGKTIISTDLKYEFNDSTIKNTKIDGEFKLELKIYCGNKLMKIKDGTFYNTTLNTAIRKIFKDKIEEEVTFHQNHKYYATFKVYKLVPVRRAKYKKTDTYINTNRRKYLLQERINIWI